MRLLAYISPLLGFTVALAGDLPGSFGYVLQADSLAQDKAAAVLKFAACDRDWIVLDATFDEKKPWLREDLDAIRRGRPGRKLIAYISVGEAENYRPYS